MRIRLMSVVMVVLLAGGVARGEKVAVEVTGRGLTVNGHRDVPRGLFGVHAMYSINPEVIEAWGIECVRGIHHHIPGGPTVIRGHKKYEGLSMFIDCQGDRFQPALPLVRKDYASFLSAAGKTLGERSRGVEQPVYIEFWNEPYLNWADKSRVNYQTRFFETSGAKEGGVVTIKGWEKPLEHLRWREAVRAVDAKGEATMQRIPDGKQVGDSFEVTDRKGRKQTYTVKQVLEVHDPTQVSYWSGRQNRDFYLWMLEPFARSLKSANPDVKLIAGWDFHIYSSGWKGWEELYRPTIDATAPWIDGVSEHHYGSDPLATAASYEVVTAYGMSKHGKWLHSYNTECGGKADPAVPGNEHLGGKDDPLRASASAYAYGLRDIMHLLRFCPDKAMSRTTHMPDNPAWGKGGDEYYFRLLKPVRGRLMQVMCGDPDVWAVAALNGDELALAVYNNKVEVVELGGAIRAPGEGIEFACPPVVRWVEVDEEERKLAIRSREVRGWEVEGAGQQGRMSGERIGPRQAVVMTFPLVSRGRDSSRAMEEVAYVQCFGGDVLQRVEPGEPVTMKVRVEPSQARKLSGRNWLKLVVQGMPGDARVRVNGQSVALPQRQWIVEVDLPKGLIRSGENVLVFEAPSRGYLVNMASAVVEMADP